MNDHARHRWSLAAALLAVVAIGSCGPPEERPPEPTGQPESTGEEQAGGTAPEGEPLEGQEAAAALMAQWRRANPDREWIAREQETHTIAEPADNSVLVGNPQGATYGRITERDVEVWRRETVALVTEGSRVFHSADELGSTIGVSCDMCHPDGANTHPETYPKFQVQMGRVALLRDMVNWCIEQASRGEPLEPDSPKMRALEAYIYAQRRGTDLDYGRR